MLEMDAVEDLDIFAGFDRGVPGFLMMRSIVSIAGRLSIACRILSTCRESRPIFREAV